VKEKPRLKEVQVAEKELEDLLIKDLSIIDPDLEYLGRQTETDTGPLDILAYYKQIKSLVVIELKVKEDDSQLFQALRYYDWIRSRVELIRRIYKKDIDLNAEDWLILVAPSFSDSLKKVARYINMPVNLFEFTVLELPDGNKHVICKDIDYGEPYETKEIPTIEAHLIYITDSNARAICSDAIESLKNKGIEVLPITHRLNLLFNSKLIGKIRVRRNFFGVRTRFKNQWSDYTNIYTRKDWDNFLKYNIEPYL
jgi:hypothetical protein